MKKESARRKVGPSTSRTPPRRIVLPVAGSAGTAGQPLRAEAETGGGNDGRFTPTLWVMLVVALALALAAGLPDGIVHRAPEPVGHALSFSRIPLVGCAAALALGVVIGLTMGAT